MDKRLIRLKAKAEYKKLMKGTPKAKRAPFAQVWPFIRANMGLKAAQASNSQLGIEDSAAIESMLAQDDTEHIHGPGCQHEHHDNIIEAEVIQTNTIDI